jgi:Tfp pilus assembly protein PilF
MKMNSSNSLKNLKIEQVDELFDSALRMVNADDWDSAEPILRRFAEEYPDYEKGKVWYELADILERRGDISNAEAAYRKALSYQPNWDIFLESFAHFLWRNGRKDDALEVTKRLRALMDTAYIGFPVDRLDRFLAALGSGLSYAEYQKNEANRSPTSTENHSDRS